MLLNEDIIEAMSSLNDGSATELGNQIITEAILQDALVESGQSMLSEDLILEILSEELLSEKNILKWDKKAKRKHATNKAAIVIAREKGDKDYKKLVTVFKMRRKLLDRINAKYGNKAKLRVKEQEKNKKVAKVVAATKKNVSIKGKDLPKR